MPVGINFNKAKAEQFLAALATGQPFTPTGSTWTLDDMLALAGVCHFGAMSHGPVRLSDRDLSQMHPERREAGDETFLADLLSAVAFYSELTMQVKDRRYDEAFEPELRAIVFNGEDGPSVTPVSGFRAADGE